MLYHTEDDKICLGCQLDENYILVTYDASMTSLKPKEMKILVLERYEVFEDDILICITAISRINR